MPEGQSDWSRILELEAALADAIRVIELLAEQQAMPDDWYEEPLARFRDLTPRGQNDR